MFLKLILDPSNYEKKKILLLRFEKIRWWQTNTLQETNKNLKIKNREVEKILKEKKKKKSQRGAKILDKYTKQKKMRI